MLEKPELWVLDEVLLKLDEAWIIHHKLGIILVQGVRFDEIEDSDGFNSTTRAHGVKKGLGVVTCGTKHEKRS